MCLAFRFCKRQNFVDATRKNYVETIPKRRFVFVCSVYFFSCLAQVTWMLFFCCGIDCKCLGMRNAYQYETTEKMVDFSINMHILRGELYRSNCNNLNLITVCNRFIFTSAFFVAAFGLILSQRNNLMPSCVTKEKFRCKQNS